MQQYLDLLRTIKEKGFVKEDRTGTGTLSHFGHQMRFDLREGFPIVTTKRVWWRAVVAELLWMIGGETNVKILQDQDIHIWDEWADENGDLGPVYGKMWRSFPSAIDGEPAIDQLKFVIEKLKQKPTDRRLIVCAWHPSYFLESPDMHVGLPPCHMLFQFWSDGEYLSCQMYQRSADSFIGIPFNIASYALLTHIVAQLTGLKPLAFIHTFGDVHIYDNHHEQIDLQLTREPKKLPEVWIDPDLTSIDEVTMDTIVLAGYEHHPAIKAPIAV